MMLELYQVQVNTNSVSDVIFFSTINEKDFILLLPHYMVAFTYNTGWITMDVLGGRVEFRRVGDTSCTVLEGGNPPVSLTSTAIALYGQSLSIINLPGLANFEKVEPVSALNWGQFWLGKITLYNFFHFEGRI